MSMFSLKDKNYTQKSMPVIAGCVVYVGTLWSPYYDYVDGWFSVLIGYSILLAPSEKYLLTKAVGVVLIIPHVVMLGVLTQLYRIKKRTGCGLLFRVLMSVSALMVFTVLLIGGKAGFTIRYGMYLLLLSQLLVLSGCYLLRKGARTL